MPIDEHKCIGCGGCLTVCRLHAIEMMTDNYGFYRPFIDITKCIDCGACTRVCPKNDATVTMKEKTFLAVQNENINSRKTSSSGGAFEAFANYILSNNGVVFGTAYNESFTTHIIYITSIEQLHMLKGAKYIQSKAWESYPLVENFLKDDRFVLFTGTPCQVATLRNYLRKDYSNLVCAEIACHGVPSKLMFDSYIRSLKRKFRIKGSIKSLNFREKYNTKDGTYSWKNYRVHISFQAGKDLSINYRNDYYMQAFFSDLSVNPKCYECNHKLFQSKADVTMADFWGVQNADIPDDDKGISLLVIHTKRGEEIFGNVKQQFSTVIKLNQETALARNPYIVKPPCPHSNYEKFQNKVSAGEDFINTLFECMDYSFKTRVKNNVSLLMERLGLK